ncbi:hypothetical protein EOD42_24720 [Rhodovarius crocodyli]|uniref:Lipoprotein n=1 Tax=Rhodovarius crocodyli TaxID=1979269 RepID=A0A437LX68_9PROT|nr:hypothetical protein [Rhodovarius crocodyli]RVT89969.1 hypothetical protein EOD42_24720 [Rhodovarius crocodyli]
MRRIATLSLLLGLGACAMPEETPPAAAPASVVQRTPEQVASRLPEQLNEFRRGNRVQMRSGTGIEYPYATSGRRIAGQVQIRPGTPGTSPETELGAMATEAATNPQYRRLREASRETIAGMSCMLLAGNFSRTPVESLACAGVFDGQVVRMRLTMSRAAGRMDEAKQFAEGLAAALR